MIGSVVSHFSTLGWIEILAAAFVAVGCIGELILVFQKSPPETEAAKIFEKKKHRLERVFVFMVAIGVSVELLVLPFGLREAARFNEIASRANERAANIESNNAVLFTIGERAKESAARATEQAEKAKAEREKAEAGRLALQAKVIELEQQAAQAGITASNALSLSKKASPRRLTEEQQRKLFSLLENVPKSNFAFNLDPRVDDAEGIATDLLPIMIQRGFKFVGTDRLSQSGGVENHGINVYVTETTNMPVELINTLNAVRLNAHPGAAHYGFVVTGTVGTMKSAGVVYLDIGFR